MKCFVESKEKGIAQLVILGVIALMAVMVPVTSKLVQQNQENRSKAAGSKANGSSCTYGSECTSGFCNNNRCVPSATSCWNAQLNKSMSDGSVVCANGRRTKCNGGMWGAPQSGYKCANGDLCMSDDQCTSGKCSDFRCVASVDKPTPTSVKKANGSSCTYGSECTSGFCNNNRCVPSATSCWNAQLNKSMSDGSVVCANGRRTKCNGGMWGAPQSGYKCANGDLCMSDDQCTSGKCSDFRCVASVDKPTPTSVKKVNGKCGTGRNSCASGVSSDRYYADTSTYYIWRCSGQNGGTSVKCSLKKFNSGGR